MPKKDGRGGYRPGSGRKPIPSDDIARIKRMLASNISKYRIAKTLGYGETTVKDYAKKFEAGNDAE